MRKIGVDIIQPMVPPYRVALFEKLDRDPELSVSLQCAPEWPRGQRSIPLSMTNYFPDRITVRIAGTSLLWQRGLRLICAKGPGDVLVICGDMHYLSNLRLIFLAKSKGIGIVWWGHHRSATSTRLKIAVRLALARRVSDCVLTYTKTGIEYLAARGFDRSRLFATNNTIDLGPVEKAKAEWPADRLNQFQRREGIENKNILLFCSVLNPKTQLDLAIRALQLLSDPSYELVVIGNGPMMDEYKSVAVKCGVSDRIRWLGEIRDERRLAPWFLSAKAFVYPGVIGLSLIHAFAYGLPVITHGNPDHHMPEFEAATPGKNSLTFKENDPYSLARAICTMLSNEARRIEMGRAAYETVHENYTMEKMVANFKACLIYCSELSIRKSKSDSGRHRGLK